MHDAGVIHNDIKSSNLLCGQHKKSTDKIKRCRIIDFGCASSYLDKNGNHVKEEESVSVFHGNVLLSSYDALCFKKPSRKSEMISLGYYLLSMIDDFVLLPFMEI